MNISHFVLGWGLFSVLTIAPSALLAAETSFASQLVIASEPLIGQSRQLYESGQFSAAAQLLQQAADEFAAKGDFPNQAIALSNLSLAYQKLGQWEAATQAIDRSLMLVQFGGVNSPEILAQTLHIRGQLFLSTGQSESALNTWKQATEIYEQSENEMGAIASRINQAEALQSLGLYRTALDRLREVTERLQEQPDSSLKAIAFLSLGNTLRVSGQLKPSENALLTSLGMARRLQLTQMIADASLSLGNLYQARAQNASELNNTPEEESAIATALQLYEKVGQTPGISQSTQIDAQLNTLNILIFKRQWSKIEALRDQIAAQIESLPPSRQSIFARVNLIRQSLEFWQYRDEADVGVTGEFEFDRQSEQFLKTAIQQSQQLKDSRAESFALGTLGKLYEQKQQFPEAQITTEKALSISQSIQAGDIAYELQWQLGRVLDAQHQKKAAIAAYAGSVNTLKTLRSDLAATTPDLQFSFRENVEPIYRQLVELLLQTEPEASPSQQDLLLARETIEALQLAELDNFFREACIEAEPKTIDQIDAKAAVIYSIEIGNRLEVIASFPEQPLRHHRHMMDGNGVSTTINALRPSIFRRTPTRSAIDILPENPQTQEELLALSQQLYDWLIRPIETDLDKHKTETLVFISDGALRSIPMSILHDGEQYLIEKYAIALTPGLQLLAANPFTPSQLQTLASGLSDIPSDFQGIFNPLSNVEDELEDINQEVGGIVRLNDKFTSTSLQADINTRPFSIIHLATHGVFSSNREETFVLAWDGKINVDRLTDVLQSREEGRRTPIDLLVLSACQTAAGDDRAPLGLAGVAIRAGTRSTVASLWSVDDEATSVLMSRFYQELAKPNTTKAQALRHAQLSLLQDETQGKWHHPYYWSAFVLVGNWN
jgi:CHAT domain-containing protein